MAIKMLLACFDRGENIDADFQTRRECVISKLQALRVDRVNKYGRTVFFPKGFSFWIRMQFQAATSRSINFMAWQYKV